jgi:pimeloyl-ACP methyl ester carboxylesterase
MLRSLPIARFAALAVLTATAAQAADAPAPQPKPFSRDAARAIVKDARRILAPTGVEEMRQVELGGVPQWISVRGRDTRNPILLFIHGGPASTEMPTSWLYQSAWEDFFTVVQWDQRGAGKTAATTDNRAVMPTVTVERMTQDGEELVAWLRAHYGKRKVIVMAHSWGTVIGMNLAIRHPDWLHAYVGMGQIIDWQSQERAGYAFALREAAREHNAQALADLKSIAPYPPPNRPATFDEIVKQRTWVIHYGGLTAHRQDFDYDENARKLAPEYTDRDLSPPGFQDGEALVRLLPELSAIDFTTVTKLDTPVFIFAGRRDYETPSEVAAAWYAKVKAPRKGFFWFDQSAHMMQLEQPGKVLLRLVNEVRPIAAKAGDVAPEDRPGVD